MKTQRFGIEIEMTGITRQKAAEVIAQYFETSSRYAGSGYSTYEDLEDLQEIIRQLRHAGAFVNQSCGIHIHVDAAVHTPETLKNLVNLMAQKRGHFVQVLADCTRAFEVLSESQ